VCNGKPPLPPEKQGLAEGFRQVEVPVCKTADGFSHFDDFVLDTVTGESLDEIQRFDLVGDFDVPVLPFYDFVGDGADLGVFGKLSDIGQFGDFVGDESAGDGVIEIITELDVGVVDEERSGETPIFLADESRQPLIGCQPGGRQATDDEKKYRLVFHGMMGTAVTPDGTIIRETSQKII
jgi:hypothetical protein